jgi:hypothetical protein
VTEQLTTQNATITTATIQVQALTIGRKQVTQSVFRQLSEEPLIADNGTLNGEPWGLVNYHPDKCGDFEEHVHVVWQRGTQLLRSAIYAPPFARHHTKAAGAFAEAAIAEGAQTCWAVSRELASENVDDFFVGRPSYQGASAHVRFRYQGVRFFGEISPDAYMATRGDGDARQRVRNEITIQSTECLKSLPVVAYRAAWQALKELPQLFIAV